MEASSPRRRRGSNAAKVDTNDVDDGGITVRAHARSDANVRDWGRRGAAGASNHLVEQFQIGRVTWVRAPLS